MALDRQKILDELSNVVYQLQRADCGCMGKLFNQGDPNMSPPAYNGCMQGWCQNGGYGCQGYNSPGAGEPYAGNQQYMGSCNPPNSYNYFNQNMMQPVVKEVYDELRSMTPNNTVVNSPMAAQMGLGQGNNQSPPGAGYMAGNMGNMNQNHNMQGGMMRNINQNQIQGVGMGNPNATSNNQLVPHLHFGNPNLGYANNANTNQQQMNMAGMGRQMMKGSADARNANMPNQGGQQGNSMAGGPIKNPTTQYMSQPNMYTGANAPGNPMSGNMALMKPGSQQMRAPNQQMSAHNSYGQHSAGMAKFHEMFPGLSPGGDLGFDPMAIAIQMNPANRQKAAMDTMHDLMMGKGNGGINAAAANLAQFNQLPINQGPGQQLQGANAGVPVQNNQVPQQQVHAAKGAPNTNQQQMLQQETPQQQGAVNGSLSTIYERPGDPNARQEGVSHPDSAPPKTTAQKLYLDPILPADTSRNMSYGMKPEKYYQYNTIGQPVQMIPGRLYRSEEFNLPQTLSPQPVPSRARSDPMRFSNVKSTISKTSIMGDGVLGQNPSRTQLQHLYTQYRGSHSFTQPGQLKQTENPGSYSEGNLNVQQQQDNSERQIPVEKVGGDTVANNAIKNKAYRERMPRGQGGDVPAANKPPLDAEKIPVKGTRVRNGLQDQTYTAYTTSAAWTFHGATPAPYSNVYRFRQRAS